MQANIRAEVNKGLNVAVEKKILLSLHRLIFKWKVAKFSKYNIRLLGLSEGEYSYEFNLDNVFFQDIDEEEIRKGDVKVLVKLLVTSSTFDFSFDIQGTVKIPCNRCLDEMTQFIETQNRLIVKLGSEYSEESDEVVIIPQSEGEINIAWFLYEFIALNIPIKHFHEQGKCNRFMNSKLNKHRAVDKNEELEEDDIIDDNSPDYPVDDDSSDNIDPRWSGLKDLSFEDN